MGKPTLRAKWWIDLIESMQSLLHGPASLNLIDAAKRDTGHDDEALREHWYWEGYCAALRDLASMKKEPTLPENEK